MRSLKAVLSLTMLILSVSFCSAHAYSENGFTETNEVPLWLVLHFNDYMTDMPVSNVSISATIHTDWGLLTLDSILTNETGTIQVFLGNVTTASSFTYKRLQEIELSDNYTLIKVQDVLVEDTGWSTQNYEAEYVTNFTKHRGLRINLAYKDLEDHHFIEGNIWVLKGTLVRVSDSNPVTGEKENLIATPAIKTTINSEISEFESYFFFPLGYEVTIFHGAKTSIDYVTMNLEVEDPITPLRVKVDQNTSLVNWMYHAAQEYVDRQIYHMDKEMKLPISSGYPLDLENEEYEAIKKLLERVLKLYEEAEYASALGGAKMAEEKLSDLNKWLSDLKVLAVLTTVGISLFAYGLASLLSGFVFEEPTENKIRLVSKVLMFSLALLMFSLSHPSIKMAFSFIVGIRTATLPLSLLGCFTIGGLTYFFFQLFSVRKKGVMDLALQLGVRSLKRRLSRTLLTLITITIVVSSAIVFVNISMNRATRIKGQWKGSDTSGVLVIPDTYLAPLSEYDVNWIGSQEWCKNLTYTEEIWRKESIFEGWIDRSVILMLGEANSSVNMIGIDPVFMEKYYSFSERVRGSWQEFSEGQPVLIVSSSLGILSNEIVTLIIKEKWVLGPGDPIIKTRTLGEYRVVGTFDHQTAFANMTKIDGTPLFEDLSLSVADPILVPIKSVVDPAITISEVMIITKDGYDPVEIAEELAYTLAAPTVANKDGLAQKIEWSIEFSVAGLIPYMPPLVIAGLMMYTTMVSIYEERKKEFTTLATLGLDPKNVFQAFLAEALLLGLMGTFLGFFGSYILGAGLFYLASFLGVQGLPAFPLSFAHWSMPAILVALLAGVVMVFLGGYIPAVKAQGLGLMGRAKKRQMIGELVSEGNVTSFTLPIRETVQNGEMLYTYVRGTIGKIKRGLVDSHSIKGEMYRDGTFSVSFLVMGGGQSITVPCEIRGVKEGEILVLVIEFPTSYKTYDRIKGIIRDFEQHMIGFSTWKEMQLKMTIVREAPKKRKSIEEILAEIKDVISQIKDCNKKLKILEAQKGKLSNEVYNEFREKYINMIEEKSKNLRSMTINLEPHHRELQGEIDKVAVEVERITTAYNLGEITEEEYVKTCGPLQATLAELKDKVKELEDIFEFLKTPLGITYD
jgi:ABC-type lipoprotein release transport system permease subunit